MKLVRRVTFAAALVVLVCSRGVPPLDAQTAAKPIQGPEIEAFLTNGRILRMADIPIGVAAPRKATLEHDGVQHFAVFKTIDVEQRGVSQLTNGVVEVNFQDSWRTEIAAYRIDRMLGLGLVPATVERQYQGKRGSLQWWVDDSIQEGEREKRKLSPPDPTAWNQLQYKMRLFDNLIYNTDRTKENILITPADFRVYLIDHSRSFRLLGGVRTPDGLPQFSRAMLDAMKRLDAATVRQAVGSYLSSDQIKTMLQRRDALIALANRLVAQRGEAAVLY